MKNLILAVFLIISSVTVMESQDVEPVTWEVSVSEISKNEFNIIIQGNLLDDWHLFSQFTDEGGSLPAKLNFINSGENYQLIGPTTEGDTFKAYNDIFNVEETYFINEARFTQRVKLLNTDVRQISVILSYQVCNEVCLNKEKQFNIGLDGGNATMDTVVLDEKSEVFSKALRLDLKNKQLLQSSATPLSNDSSLWKIFVLGFLGGLVALLTPCVFPMIPLTVSYFTTQSGSKVKSTMNAMTYGLFIFLIYLALSIPFHFLDSVNPEILNTISTNVWLNIAFFLIFVVFAFSFFGYFELTLPHSWSNKMDSSSNIGGILGIFFMALTLALVSFSCTGPILGSLLAGSLSADGGAMELTAGMGGFGIALAMPFALFALFPKLLVSLPKSGSWLNTVKVVLGFIELGMAFKFLSNADLVSHWGLLKREVFIGIWIILFVLSALYFLGIVRFPHKKRKKLSFGNIATGIIIGGIIIYLSSGLQKNAPLTLLSGFPPPSFYSLYDQEYDCPLGLDCFKDFDEGYAYAKAKDKPILLDFTGWACVNCRKMEENVWSIPKIHQILKNDFVLISLYVDDRKPLGKLSEFNYKVSDTHLKLINTVGDKWATFQSINFKTSSQPYYVTLNPNLELLNQPIQYSGIEEYYLWLKRSLDKTNY